MLTPLFRALVTALLVAAPLTLAASPAQAGPGEEYSGPYFGEDNFPPGCIRNMSGANPANTCYHMRTGLNALDSPQVDVVVLVPVSPTAERDMRVMRQAVEMWEGGIDYLAQEMGLDWLADGVDFHITLDYVDLSGNGGEFTTYPLVDPEIVVIASNPVGGIGIGFDPAWLTLEDENGVPCHNIENPFDFEYWENLPGFNNHHESRTGTYVEDCGGAGGNVCFAVNGAVDPAPEVIDFFGLFDLVAHEFGHCLTLGHVGDGAEGSWGLLPSNDIMAYSQDPPNGHKCVSTLDVEVLATRMSQYLDVNGDAAVDGDDRLYVNDQIGEGGNAFQVQHPGDHLYASSTGSPANCPQPDLGLVPGPRTDWTPAAVATTEPTLTVSAPTDGATSATGDFNVTGTVGHEALNPVPTSPIGSFDDDDNDASAPVTEIQRLDVEVTATHIEATITLEELWPSTTVVSPTAYSLLIDGGRFDSFVRYPIDNNPLTWDNNAVGYMPDGTSTWDLDANTVSFHIPRATLAAAGIMAPYYIGSQARIGLLTTGVIDDAAPEAGDSVGVAGARVIDVPALATQTSTVTFEREGGNVFYPEESTLGETDTFGLDTSHFFSLEVPQPADVEFTLSWTGVPDGSDLDLFVAGSIAEGATIENPETVTHVGVEGTLDIRVEPYLVVAPMGVTYTLTATITPIPDGDGDGVGDSADACPTVDGDGSDGCPIVTGQVHLYVDDVLTASQNVATGYGSDDFDFDVTVADGAHVLRLDWEDEGTIVATKTVTVTNT